MALPKSNGISRWQHGELLKYFSAPTLKERERPPLLKEGLKLSMVAKEHLARLDNERKAAKEAQGLAPTMGNRVANWWDQGPKVKGAAPVSPYRFPSPRSLRELHLNIRLSIFIPGLLTWRLSEYGTANLNTSTPHGLRRVFAWP